MRFACELLVAATGLVLLVWSLRAGRDWFDLHVGEEFCVNDPAQLRARTAWRVAGAVVGLLLVTVVRSVTGRWASRRTARGVFVAVARLVGPALLALVVSDCILRSTLEPSRSSLQPFLRPDPRYGWAYRSHTTTTIPAGDREVMYSINARGDRARTEDDSPDLSKPTILIAGESIASGFGVQWDESFAGLLEQRFHVQTVNSSVYAWDHSRAFVRMLEELAELSAPIAVVMLTVPAQLERDATPTHPRFTLDSDGSLVERPSAPEWWSASPLRKLANGIVVLHDDEPLRVARAVFTQTARSARARHAYPLVVLTNWGKPCLPDETGAPSIDRRLFEGVDAPHIRVDLDGSCEDPTTHHTNQRGHARLADAIERSLRAAGVAQGAAAGP